MKHQRLSGAGLDISSGTVLLKGRHECQCEATEHKLINNCINCGRIVCEQEGSGPCFTCKNLVCTNEQREILNRNSKNSAKLYEKLMGENTPMPNLQSGPNTSWELNKAVEHKNKLLDFNRTTERRTKVIDDESDYYNAEPNKWMSSGVREAILEKQRELDEQRHGSRLNKKVMIDFAGRQVHEDPVSCDFDIDQFMKDDTSIFECNNFVSTAGLEDYVPEYYENPSRVHITKPYEDRKKQGVRIQDKELQFMSDDGLCLSVNQPHASLMIAGIKKHEGRNWYTSYRGRLWLHASQREPPKEEIIQIEKSYRLCVVDDKKFPTSYPTGVVIGCVDLIACLTQEEYREEFPDGESASPFVFICDNPQELKIKFPMRGKKKIFKMDPKFHLAAKKTLQKLI